jgi:hypothetical protein
VWNSRDQLTGLQPDAIVARAHALVGCPYAYAASDQACARHGQLLFPFAQITTYIPSDVVAAYAALLGIFPKGSDSVKCRQGLTSRDDEVGWRSYG